MSYTIDYLEDKKIVQIRIEGIINFRMAKEYSMDAIKLAREYNCKKFLFNHLKTLMEAGIYKLLMDGDTLEKFGFQSSERIAIVISGNNKNSHLSNTSVSNVKWSNFKYFNNLEKAVDWLGQDEQ